MPAPLVAALARTGIVTPFPIQAATLPDVLAGRDILGQGQTGSGKTLGFSIPLAARLAGGFTSACRPRGLVLVPTRELASQVQAVLAPLASAAGLTVTAIFGGVPQNPQVAALRNRADVIFGTHTPWGGQDQVPVVAPPETELERALSKQIMQGGQRPAVRNIRAGEFLFRQAEETTSIAVILDGNFEVRVDGKVVGQAGPGTVAGERASLEGGQRTADLCALTDARVAETSPGTLSVEQLSDLTQGHHREDPQ